MSIFYVAAHALVMNSEKKILALRRAEDNDYMPLKWDIPGGTVEVGETVEEALVRELKEETCIEIKPLYPIYVHSNLSQLPKRQTVQIVYICEYQKGEVMLNPREHTEYQWMHYDDLNKLDCIAFLEGLLTNYEFC